MNSDLELKTSKKLKQVPFFSLKLRDRKSVEFIINPDHDFLIDCLHVDTLFGGTILLFRQMSFKPNFPALNQKFHDLFNDILKFAKKINLS